MLSIRTTWNIPVALLFIGTLAACGGDDDNGTGDTADSGEAFTLQMLHFSDIDGSGGVDNVRGFSRLVDAFRTDKPDNTLLVSSGDNFIPGPEFFAASDDALAETLGQPGNGRANIAWLNDLGVQATAMGNHDLDPGPEAFVDIVTADGDYPGARFPYLSANLDFADDENTRELVVSDGQPAQANSLAGSATIEVGGRTIGLVGATTPALASITNTGDIGVAPNNTNDNQALAAAIQPAVDALRDQGIDIIVLLAHLQQIALEEDLASRLSGVDIIVAGGSNTLLADFNDGLRPGDTAADTFPLRFQSASDEPVLVVNTAGDFRYLGRLVVAFDDHGVVQPDSIDPVVSGAFRSDREPPLPGEPIAGVTEVADALAAVLNTRDGNVFGQTEVFLDGRRGQVRTDETNLGDLTAEANLSIARQADATVVASIKNAGGIRNAIGQAVQPAGSNDPADIQLLPPAARPDAGKPAGGISQLDIQTALRFDNGLALLTLTAAELADVIEHTVAATAEGATPGQFSQVAGLRFSFDPTNQARTAGDTNQADINIAGNRLRNLAVVDDDGAVVDRVVVDGVVNGDPGRTFRIVTLDFLASCVPDGGACGDGYPFNGLLAPDRMDIAAAGTDPGQADFGPSGGEQDALAEFLAASFPVNGTPFDRAETDPANDERIQDLSVRAADTVFSP